MKLTATYDRGGNPVKFYIDGREVPKAEYDAALPRRLGLAGRGKVRSAGIEAALPPAGWPMECENLAVHKSQIAEMSERAAKHGVPTRFNPDTGSPVFENKAHRKAYLKFENVFDRNSFLGD